MCEEREKNLKGKRKDETRFERVTYRTAAGCSTPELLVLGLVLFDGRQAPVCGLDCWEGFLAGSVGLCFDSVVREGMELWVFGVLGSVLRVECGDLTSRFVWKRKCDHAS